MTEIALRKRYTLKSRIGQGGEGTVYEATASDGTAVALKELHGLVADPEQHHLESQLRVLASLEDIPGIPQIQERGFSGERYYIVSEFIEGDSLEHMVVSGRRFGRQEAEQFMRNMLETMQLCHERGIIIRDIKPDNIKLNERPWIVDINALGDAYAESQTIGVGTLGYTAPEQKNNEAVFASDIYSLGKTVYRAMTGRTVSGTKELTDEDFAVMRNIHSGLADIIQKMCEPALERRYKSVADVLHDLDNGYVTVPLAVAKQKTKAPKVSWLEYYYAFFFGGFFQRGNYRIIKRDKGYVIVNNKRNILFNTAERPLTKKEASSSYVISNTIEILDIFVVNMNNQWGVLNKDGSFTTKRIRDVDYIPLHSFPIQWNKKMYREYVKGGQITREYIAEDGTELPKNIVGNTIINGLSEDYALVEIGLRTVQIIDCNNKPVFGGIQNTCWGYDNTGGLEVMIFKNGHLFRNEAFDIMGNKLYQISDPDYSSCRVELNLTAAKPAAAPDGRVFRQLDVTDYGINYQKSHNIIADQDGKIVYKGERVLNMIVTSEHNLRIQTQEGFTDISI